jgi:RNA 2',3'-cyclic 3'-phosphodiesterase
VPDEARARLDAQLAPYRRAFPDARWTHPRTWHLTLLFLGSVQQVHVARLEQLVEAVGIEVAPYAAVAERGGGRARQQGGVAWVALGTGAGELIEAATIAVEHCPPDITEGPPPRRTPSAHLTVSRHVDESVIEALRSEACGPLSVRWMVDRIQLVRSHLEPGGARYETLYETTM